MPLFTLALSLYSPPLFTLSFSLVTVLVHIHGVSSVCRLDLATKHPDILAKYDF